MPYRGDGCFVHVLARTIHSRARILWLWWVYSISHGSPCPPPRNPTQINSRRAIPIRSALRFTASKITSTPSITPVTPKSRRRSHPIGWSRSGNYAPMLAGIMAMLTRPGWTIGRSGSIIKPIDYPTLTESAWPAAPIFGGRPFSICSISILFMKLGRVAFISIN